MNIAYQVVGSGPIDIVLVMGWTSHVEYGWELPSLAHFVERLTSFSRVEAKIENEWGGAWALPIYAPSMVGDPAFAGWWATYSRLGASPGGCPCARPHEPGH